MEIFDETKRELQTLWTQETARQNAKILIAHAIGVASDVSVKVTQEILAELDRVLLPASEETESHKNRGL